MYAYMFSGIGPVGAVACEGVSVHLLQGGVRGN